MHPVLAEGCMSVACQHEQVVIFVFNLKPQTTQTESQSELRDRVVEEYLKSKLLLSMRRTPIAIRTSLNQMNLQ